jgi:hypothetical protein
MSTNLRKNCNDPTCTLTREGIQHNHRTDEERKKYRINRKKEALKSLFYLDL